MVDRFWKRCRVRLGLLAAFLMVASVGCARREVVIPSFDPEAVPLTPGAPSARLASPQAQATARAMMKTAVSVTPSPTPTRVPPDSTATTYTVKPGDTMLRVAALYGTTVEALMRLNGLSNADQLVVGQVLQVGLDAEHTGPARALLPDSELVYGPGYADFDVAAEVARHPGLLAHYAEAVNGRSMTGAEIVELVAEQYSVGPRVLLALLELRGGWLSSADPTPTQRSYPLGYMRGAYWEGLYRQLSQAANGLNTGFYGWWLDELWLIQTGDGTFIQYSTELNAATAGVQKMLADTADGYEAWLDDIDRFRSVYESLFGDPFQYAVEPLIPAGAVAPALALPWPEGETWYYTGGPHPGWGTLGAFSAVDFVTGEEHIGCATSQQWVTAVAPGLVVRSEDGMVLQDLDGDGFTGTGWVILYMH
ncbi:MAG: LysM peptidoglycan-binding domain-containing protein, partial [Anaerolineae bacterium]